MKRYDLLLIENSADDALLIIEGLRLYGVDSEWKRVEDRDALIAALPSQRWDAVLCDYSLPAMSAEDALDAVRAFDPELPFILVSGTVSTRTAVDMMRRGMHDYILKNDLDRLGPSLEREIRDADHRRNETSAMNELDASRRRFALTFEQSAVGMAETDPNGKYLWVNQRFADMLGFNPGDIINHHYSQFSHPDGLSDQTRLHSKLLKGSLDWFNVEKRYLRKDGSELWTLLTVTAIRNDHREVESIVTVVQDITARKAAQDALQQREDEYRSLVDTMKEGLIALDPDLRIIFANRSFCDLVGLSQYNIIGKIFSTFVPPENDELLRHTSMEESDIDREWQLKRPDGKVIWVRSHHVPRYDDTAGFVGTLVVFTEITEQKTAEVEREQFRMQVEQLTRLESLGKLAGTIAHEFNNVLMGIQPFTEVISRRSHDAKILDAATNIRNSVNRGSRVSREILQYARPVQPCRQIVEGEDLMRLVEKAATGMLPPEIDFRCGIRSGTGVLPMAVDVEQIQQVFLNLIINARDAMPRGGSLRITAMVDRADEKFSFGVVPRPDHYTHFVVADTGTGIPSDTLHRIFEPMFTTKRVGTGLGLAVTHQIISSHSGFIFVESRVDEGTSFHIFIPLEHAGESEEATVPAIDRAFAGVTQ